VTKVLDNGVNIKDDELKHIVIYTNNQTEFIQMLGRKRRKDDEIVNLYLKHRSEDEMYRDYNNSLMKKISFMQLHQDIHADQYFSKSHLLKIALKRYIDNYTHSGKIRNEYSLYLSLNDSCEEPFENHRYEYQFVNMFRIIQSYRVNPYFQNKFNYDFFQCASRLQNAKRHRYAALREWCLEQCYYDVALKRNDKENELWEAYVIQDKKLSGQQYTWLKYQLSWLNLDKIPEFDPSKPDRWISGHLRNFEEYWNDMCRFISDHMSSPTERCLNDEQINQFKKLIERVKRSLGDQKRLNMDRYDSRERDKINTFLQEHGINIFVDDRSTKKRIMWELRQRMLN